MLSKNLFKVVDYVYSACDHQLLLPYSYDRQNRRLLSAQSFVRQAAWHFQIAVLLFQASYLFLRLLFTLIDPTALVEEKCRLIFIFIVFLDQSVFQVNLWQKQSEIAWLFNECSRLTKHRGDLRNKSTKIEHVMLGWPVIHMIIFCGIIGEFVKNPMQRQHFYSVLPADFHVPQIFGFSLFLETVATLAFIHTCQFEFLFHTLVIRCQIEWTAECTKPPKNEADIEATLRKYRELRLIQQSFNRCFGKNIEQIKSGMILVNVANNYVLIKRWSVLSHFMIADLMSAELFAHTLPPFLYGSAYKIRENSEATRRILSQCIFVAKATESREYFSRVINTLRPICVRVAGMYFLDKMMTPTFYEIILSSTVNMILSN